MNATLDEKKNILEFAGNFSNIVREGHWISHYDADSDSFTIRAPKLSKDSRKKYFADEYAFYLNNKNGVEGLFIEYFVSNFVSHHKDFKSVLKELKKKDDKAIVELNKSEVNKISSELESIIVNSLIPNESFLGTKC